jgi:uncharacterized protein YjbI with pentapeptide repeats
LLLPQHSDHNYRHGGAFMANEEHLRILRSGVEKWNEWRPNESRPDLRDANLRLARLSNADVSTVDFSDADLTGVNLIDAHLNSAKMVGANLSYALLSHTDLTGADLSEANLRGAHLTNAHFYGTALRGADLTDALLGWSSFSAVSLRGIKGLAQVHHEGPSGISIDTLEQTAEDLARDPVGQQEIEVFHRGAGVPKDYIDFFRSRSRRRH